MGVVVNGVGGKSAQQQRRRRNTNENNNNKSDSGGDKAVDRKWKQLLLIFALVFAYVILISLYLENNNSSNRNRNNSIATAVNNKNNDNDNVNDIRSAAAKNKENQLDLYLELQKKYSNKQLDEKNDSDNTKEIGQDGQQDDITTDHEYIKRKGKNPKMRQRRIEKKRQQQEQLKENSNSSTTTTSASTNQPPIDMSQWTYKETAPNPKNVTGDKYYRTIPKEFLVQNDAYYLWDKDEYKTILPEWMKDYFRWHRYKRSSFGELKGESWMTERWFIVQCLIEQDKRKCGGTSDRLKPIPVLLKIAYDTKRILLIRWTKPSMLEEFLVPPVGGFDWRVPKIMADAITASDDPNISGKRLTTILTISQYAEGGMSLIRTRYQTTTPGNIYNNLIFGNDNGQSNTTIIIRQQEQQQFLQQQPNFDTVFSYVWKIMFTPSLPISQRIQSKLDRMELRPNHYVASHFRALYAKDKRSDELLRKFTTNALACATQIRPNVPIFFTSDSSFATKYAIQYDTMQQHNITVVSSIPDPNPPWHLDSFLGPINNFYDTFIDLYLIALAGCVTYSKGGYGHWGLLIGGNVHCQLRQFFIGYTPKKEDDLCEFSSTFSALESDNNEQDEEGIQDTYRYGNDNGPLFLPPMK